MRVIIKSDKYDKYLWSTDSITQCLNYAEN